MEKQNEQLNTEATDNAVANGKIKDIPSVETTANASQVNAAEPKSNGNLFATSTRVKSKVSKMVDILLWILVVVLAVMVFVRAFFYTDITVSGLSMYPTYNDEQVVRVSKVRSPKRGDVIVFYTNDIESKFLALFATKAQSQSGGKYEKYFKRLVAISGDKLWIEEVDTGVYQVVIEAPDGTVYHEDYYVLDGDVLPTERFLIYSSAVSGLGCLTNHTADNPLVVRDGYFFAIGDNRQDSYDSRSFGEVPLDRLYGVVI